LPCGSRRCWRTVSIGHLTAGRAFIDLPPFSKEFSMFSAVVGAIALGILILSALDTCIAARLTNQATQQATAAVRIKHLLPKLIARRVSPGTVERLPTRVTRGPAFHPGSGRLYGKGVPGAFTPLAFRPLVLPVASGDGDSQPGLLSDRRRP